MITEKTANRLLALAGEAQAIGDALYEHCLNDGATLTIQAAEHLAAASNWILRYSAAQKPWKSNVPVP